MSNALFNMFGGNQSMNNGPMGIVSQFQQFRKQMEGRNPNEEINKLLQSGKINQQQLNQARQMAQQMRHLLG